MENKKASAKYSYNIFLPFIQQHSVCHIGEYYWECWKIPYTPTPTSIATPTPTITQVPTATWTPTPTTP